jgi:MHS family metabolite:H+ symporter-like MFS transporter
MASFGTYFLGFAIRPLGGILFGSLGDRLGRKFVLLATVMLMGVSSTLIGLRLAENGGSSIYQVLAVSYIVEAVGLQGRVGALCLACAAAVSVVVTPLAGFLTDRYGRVIVYRNFAIFQLLMAFPVWWVLSQGNLISTLVAVSLGLGVGSWGMFGAQGAFLPELFGARHRYIGVAVAREVSAVIAGGLAPLVGAGIIAWVSRAHAGQPGAGIGAWVGIAAYLALLTLGTVFTTFITPEPKGRDLDDPRDAVQGQTLTAATTREGRR